MTDIVLDDVASGFNLSVINNNFEVVEDVVNTELMHLEGGNNVMRQSLNMNSQRILNLPRPTSNSEPARLADLQSLIEGGVNDASLITFLQYGIGAVERNANAKMAEWVTGLDFEAPTDGSDARSALQQAIDQASTLRLTEGEYTLSGPLILKSNFTLIFDPGAKLLLSEGVDNFIVRGTGLTRVTVRDGNIEGNGDAGSSAVYLVSCSNVTIENTTVKKAGSHGIYLDGCAFVKTNGCDLSSNYYYGIEDRNGIGNRHTNNLCYNNGNTGTATSTGGRGINLWKSVDCYVAGNRFVANTEYGCRIYSEAADTVASYGNRIVDNFYYDNIRADFVLYDESEAGELIKQNKVSGNLAFRTLVPTLGFSFIFHGGENTFLDNHLHHLGAQGNYAGFQFYYAVDCKLIGGSANNIRDAFAFTNATNCIVDSFNGKNVATGSGTAGIVGEGCVIRNSKFKHSGAGVNDVCFVNYNATGRNTYDNNELDGFYIGIYVGDEAVGIFRNKSINSTSVGLRKDGTSIADQEFSDNRWDITLPAEISALEKNNSTHARATLAYFAAPAAINYPVGSYCRNNVPAVGQPKGWLRTATGVPGTWVSEGNL